MSEAVQSYFDGNFFFFLDFKRLFGTRPGPVDRGVYCTSESALRYEQVF